MSRVIAGRYAIQVSLGRGGMGEVFLAQDQLLQRRVAIKEILSGRDSGLDPVSVERLIREARLAAGIQHPHVVAVHDLIVESGQTYIVMEYLEAQSLAEMIRTQTRLDPTTVARIGSQVAGALEAAHRSGIIHRDVKPSNILIDAAGNAKLADFGIARGSEDSTLTGTGMLIGSIAFMAPEVAKGEPASPAADVFSLGCTLYAATEGHAPFIDAAEPTNGMRTLVRLISQPAPPAVHAGPSAKLLARMLDQDPKARPSAGELQRQLAALSVAAPDETSAVDGTARGGVADAGSIEPPDSVSDDRTRLRLPDDTNAATRPSAEQQSAEDHAASPSPELGDASPIDDVALTVTRAPSHTAIEEPAPARATDMDSTKSNAASFAPGARPADTPPSAPATGAQPPSDVADEALPRTSPTRGSRITVLALSLIAIVLIGGGVAVAVAMNSAPSAASTAMPSGSQPQSALTPPASTSASSEPTHASSEAAVSGTTPTLVAGGEHFCSVNDSGGVTCWGANEYGQLGNGSKKSSSKPVAVAGLGTGVRALAAGTYHTCALTDKGGVKCWGTNIYGRLGNGTLKDSSRPVDVVGLSSGVVQIASYAKFSCAVTSDGAVKCWGTNWSGSLGSGSTAEASSKPVTVKGIRNATAVTVGYEHACAVVDGGDVMCWGSNSDGQLGAYDPSESSKPVKVDGLDSPVVSLYSGGWNTCAVTQSGGVRCWGGSDRSAEVVTVPDLESGTAMLAMTDSKTCALGVGGDLRCSDSETFSTGLKSAPAGSSRFAEVAIDMDQTCGRTATGSIECWKN